MFSFSKRKMYLFCSSAFIGLIVLFTFLSAPIKTEKEIIGNNDLVEQQYLTLEEKKDYDTIKENYKKEQTKQVNNIDGQKKMEKEYKQEVEKFALKIQEKNKIRFPNYLKKLQTLFRENKKYCDDEELYTSYIQSASHIESLRFSLAGDEIEKIEAKTGENILDK